MDNDRPSEPVSPSPESVPSEPVIESVPMVPHHRSLRGRVIQGDLENDLIDYLLAATQPGIVEPHHPPSAIHALRALSRQFDWRFRKLNRFESITSHCNFCHEIPHVCAFTYAGTFENDIEFDLCDFHKEILGSLHRAKHEEDPDESSFRSLAKFLAMTMKRCFLF